MADTLLLEFSDPSISLQQAVGMYDRVNDLLGVDPSLDPAGSDEWPPGLLSHVASAADGALVVVETWESRSLQDEFMRTRLQPAFAQADVPPPARMLWLTTVNSWQRSPVSV